ncbi:efflux RND transporter periplasmic adaptor subunit [Hahella sp. KA22]|uniref:efflux RND transporter periplasmic adaptor subunit n=1 Tax=Hahella sp. KA22 TaxID=1628392 RepID=UPI000FDD7D1F|nr:efflux RND transporter periplasmic adaptor subunit [Hahella sp. KA22]AZZ92154.1 efflux RND transporter periplasmic adaptor subunit [Hahella sp. KA22]QAY55525.1 efflux RND transporter periplasmic adaptor subunit [Hahella sp. KA22]
MEKIRYFLRHLLLHLLRHLMLPLFLTGCDEQESPVTAPPPPPEVGVVTLSPQDAPIRTELSGRTVAYRSAEVRPQVNGVIDHRLFTEGALVDSGQALYRIESDRYQALFDQAQANLATAQARLDSLSAKSRRYAELAANKSVSRQDHEDIQGDYRQAQASVQAAQAALQLATVDLQRTEIAAPIAGRIGRSAVSEGALVTEGQSAPLALVQQLDPIYVDLTQSSRELLSLRRALSQQSDSHTAEEVRLKLEDGSDYPHPGVLRLTEVSVNEQTGSVTLRAEFPNPDGLLLPGMFVRAELTRGVHSDVYLTPQQAVTHNARGEAMAMVVTAEEVVEERLLHILGAQECHWIVGAGLKPGDRVIVEGLLNAFPGELVRATELSVDLAAATLQ